MKRCFPLKDPPKTCEVTLVKHVPNIDDTAPTPDAEHVDVSDVPAPETDEHVTRKLAKYLDLLDAEMAEHRADKSAT
ncbi:MAG TPA: hypothetical protein DIT67_05290 [Octadecabacter sp.]|nr:hypothetical protein [Octadecabacter sp.]